MMTFDVNHLIHWATLIDWSKVIGAVGGTAGLYAWWKNLDRYKLRTRVETVKIVGEADYLLQILVINQGKPVSVTDAWTVSISERIVLLDTGGKLRNGWLQLRKNTYPKLPKFVRKRMRPVNCSREKLAQPKRLQDADTTEIEVHVRPGVATKDVLLQTHNDRYEVVDVPMELVAFAFIEEMVRRCVANVAAQPSVERTEDGRSLVIGWEKCKLNIDLWSLRTSAEIPLKLSAAPDETMSKLIRILSPVFVCEPKTDGIKDYDHVLRLRTYSKDAVRWVYLLHHRLLNGPPENRIDRLDASARVTTQVRS